MTDSKISYDGFQINWIQKYPDVPWDFQKICRLDNFRIRWVSQYPRFPWDFKVISQHRFLNITWIDKFPDAPWDFWQVGNSGLFRTYWIQKYPKKKWNYVKIYGEMFESEERYRQELLKVAPIGEQLRELDLEDIKIYFNLDYHFTNLEMFRIFPGIFSQINQPLQLQELSGEIYSLEGWFEQEDILTYARETFPELGEFDLNIDNQKDSDDEYFMASTTDSITLKLHLFQNPNGPEAMIVFL